MLVKRLWPVKAVVTTKKMLMQRMVATKRTMGEGGGSPAAPCGRTRTTPPPPGSGRAPRQFRRGNLCGSCRPFCPNNFCVQTVHFNVVPLFQQRCILISHAHVTFPLLRLPFPRCVQGSLPLVKFRQHVPLICVPLGPSHLSLQRFFYSFFCGCRDAGNGGSKLSSDWGGHVLPQLVNVDLFDCARPPWHATTADFVGPVTHNFFNRRHEWFSTSPPYFVSPIVDRDLLANTKNLPHRALKGGLLRCAKKGGGKEGQGRGEREVISPSPPLVFPPQHPRPT